MIIVEIGITGQDQLNIFENEKKRKYDVLANEMGAIHKCKTRIIPYVLAWDGIVTKFHKSYAKKLGLIVKIQSYIQFIVLKKTLESISYEYKREEDNATPIDTERLVLKEGQESSEPEGKVEYVKNCYEQTITIVNNPLNYL